MGWTYEELAQLRKSAMVADELLNGLRIRLFVTDDCSEAMQLYISAIELLGHILRYTKARAEQSKGVNNGT